MMSAPQALAFEVLTLFPGAIEAFVRAGLLGKALERDLVRVHCTDIREFTDDKHRTVDDTPFGGGAGMVMKPEPVVRALEDVAARRGAAHTILLTPSAARFDQRAAERLARLDRIALVCGRYEGIDDRVREHFVDECLSLGDFVLGGGEVAALAIIEAVARLRQGVLGNPASVVHESYARDDHGALLECPQYTRPAVFRGHAVPAVLQSGNHAAIEAWRRRAARRRTWSLRPELRRTRALGQNVAVHVAVEARLDALDPAALAEVARRHGVRSLVLLGSTRDAVLQFAEATGGRAQVTAFADLAALTRRMRPRPRIVALVPASVADASVVRRPGELVDALDDPQDAEHVDRPVVLWVPARAPEALASPPPQVTAFFAPCVSPKIGQVALATEPSIVDPSRPPTVVRHRLQQGAPSGLAGRGEPSAVVPPRAASCTEADPDRGTRLVDRALGLLRNPPTLPG